MLATLIIGLREGLEASLIVGIIAAFLRRNGKSLAAMWLGVALAVILSVAVGIGLDLVEESLPQAGQEGMEAIIGAVAIFFVTGMIAWMNTHARDMKRQLEAEATEALNTAGTYALVSMAFLAVLREGFETSVFLLATFSAAQSPLLAAAGAAIGIALSIGIGWGIYVGGVKMNLSKFFRFTGAFLILVAAGLVITSLRSAHEAGWLNAGQQTTLNLSWLVAPGTIRSALITGVLGIPSDPRLIEAIGWLSYLIPVTLFLYWPPSRRLRPRAAAKLQFAIAGALAILALGMATLYPAPRLQSPAEAWLVTADGNSSRPIGAARLIPASGGDALTLKVSLDGAEDTVLPLPDSERRHELHAGIEASAWVVTSALTPGSEPLTLTLNQVIALAGGRLPIGLNSRQSPGPFNTVWSTDRSTSVWTADGMLLDAVEHSTTVALLSGGGLQTPRTISVGDTNAAQPSARWRVSAAYRDEVVRKLNALAAARSERRFWAVEFPILLVIIIIFILVSALRHLGRLRGGDTDHIAEADQRAESATSRGQIHAAP
jgi:high-affinity iron transporter